MIIQYNLLPASACQESIFLPTFKHCNYLTNALRQVCAASRSSDPEVIVQLVQKCCDSAIATGCHFAVEIGRHLILTFPDRSKRRQAFSCKRWKGKELKRFESATSIRICVLKLYHLIVIDRATSVEAR